MRAEQQDAAEENLDAGIVDRGARSAYVRGTRGAPEPRACAVSPRSHRVARTELTGPGSVASAR